MLLLLLLVTPLVNAGDDSWPSLCTCTLPKPLETITSMEYVEGTWYNLYSYGDETCYSIALIDTGDNTMNLSLTVIMENECSQTIVTYNGTGSLGPNNKFTGITPCRPELNGDYVLLASDCENYTIYGICRPGSCEPIYYIQLKSMTPSDCTMNKVREDLTTLGLCFDNFKFNC